MTVSRVLNTPELVAEPTRAKVLKAIQDLDYVVNELARQIGTGSAICNGISDSDSRLLPISGASGA